jgi:hypothetical protein
MSATIILGVLVGLLVLVRSIRWLAVIALLVAIGYFAHTRMDYWPHEDRRDHLKTLRP